MGTSKVKPHPVGCGFVRWQKESRTIFENDWLPPMTHSNIISFYRYVTKSADVIHRDGTRVDLHSAFADHLHVFNITRESEISFSMPSDVQLKYATAMEFSSSLHRQ